MPQPSASDKKANGEPQRQLTPDEVRAGTTVIMTHAERQAFLRNSPIGELLGLSVTPTAEEEEHPIYKIFVKPTFFNDFLLLPQKVAKEIVEEISHLKYSLNQPGKVEKIKNLDSPLYSLRVRGCRVFFSYEENTVILLSITNAKSIYQKDIDKQDLGKAKALAATKEDYSVDIAKEFMAVVREQGISLPALSIR
jgi:mRNA-degrading endonuclease RelE of RelBE toxin-antitoxin system